MAGMMSLLYLSPKVGDVWLSGGDLLAPALIGDGEQ
jgi:hypothetical protein